MCSFHVPSRLAIAALVAVGVGCNPKTNDDDDGNGETPEIFPLVYPSTLRVNQSSSSVIVVQIARVNYTGAVTTTLVGAPAGVTATTSTVANTTTMTVTASASAALGTYPVTIKSTGTGTADEIIAMSITVQNASGHTYSLTATPASVTVTLGGSATVTLGAIRNGVPGEIVLQSENLPDYMSAGLSPNPVGPSGTTVTITTTNLAARGTYYIFVRGRAGGESDAVVPITVVVQ